MKKKKFGMKRVLCLLLSGVMAIGGVMPYTAYALEKPEETEISTEVQTKETEISTEVQTETTEEAVETVLEESETAVTETESESVFKETDTSSEEASETTDSEPKSKEQYTVTLEQTEHGRIRFADQDMESEQSAVFEKNSMVDIHIEPEEGYLLEYLLLTNLNTGETKKEVIPPDYVFVYYISNEAETFTYECDMKITPCFNYEDAVIESMIEMEEILPFLFPSDEIATMAVNTSVTYPNNITITYRDIGNYYYKDGWTSSSYGTVGGSGNINRYKSTGAGTFFCIQPGKDLNSGNTLKQNSTTATNYWKNVSSDKKKAIHAILAAAGKTVFSDDSTGNAQWAAVQMLIWETIEGCRNPITFSFKSTTTSHKIYNALFGSSGTAANDNIKKYYDNYASKVQAMDLEHMKVDNDVVVYGTTGKQVGIYVLVVPKLEYDTYVHMKKVDSTNTALAVGGAQYTVYTNEACTKMAHTRSGKDAIFYTRDKKTAAEKDGNYSNTLGLNPGKYWMKETKAAENYVLNEKVYPFTVEGKHTKDNPLVVGKNGSVTDKPDTYVCMKKLDSTNKALAVGGAEYTVYTDSACTKKAYTRKGNPAVFNTRSKETANAKDGRYSNTLGLDVGTYYLKETKAADGYSKNDEVYPFTIERKHTEKNPLVLGGNGSITDTPDTYVHMKKVDSTNTALAVGGAEYTVYSDSACTKKVYTRSGKPAVFITRDKNTAAAKDGRYSNTCGINPGKYYLKETKPADGYSRNDKAYPFTVTLSHTKDNPLVLGGNGSITDTPDTYVHMKKVDSTNTALAVGGAQYTVYTNEACTNMAHTRSGKDAIFYTRDKKTAAEKDGNYSNTLGLNPGKYWMKETKAAENYVLNEKVYPFTVTLSHTKDNPLVLGGNGSITNTPETYVCMKKVDATNTALAVGGAQYTVYSDAKCTDMVYTRSNNPAVFNTRSEKTAKAKDGRYSNTCGIDPGKYYLKETQPAEGYAPNNKVYPFTVEGKHTKNNPLVLGGDGSITDTPDTYVHMKKVDATDTALAVGGAEYTVYTDSACTKMAHTRKGIDAIFYTRDKKTATEKDGNYSNTLGLNPGKYWIKETKAAEKYALNKEVYTFTITTKHTKDNPLVFGEDGSVTDAPDTYVRMKKVDSTNTALAVGGAEYTAYSNEECTDMVYTRSGNPVIFYTRDAKTAAAKDGNYSNTCGLNPGTYYLKETKAAKGYSLNSKVYPFTITMEHLKDNPLVLGENGSITNTPDTYVCMKKVDSTNTALTVGGAEYTVYSDAECTDMVYTRKGNPAVFTTRNEETAKAKDGRYSNTCGINPGTYYLKETKAAKGYALNEKIYPFTVTSSHTKTSPLVIGKDGSVTDTPDTYVNIKKVDALNTALAVGGAQYTVYSDAECTDIVYTRSNNPAVFTTRNAETAAAKDGYYSNTCGLNPGKYYLKETKAADGYSLNSKIYPFTVTSAHTKNNPLVVGKSGEITDKKEGFDFTIKKVNRDNTKQIVSGAEYWIYTDKNCTVQAREIYGNPAILTTTNTGSNVVRLALGTYYIKEKTAPEGYELNPQVYTVTCNTDNAEETITAEDWVTSGDCMIKKVSTVNSDQIVSGAVYWIYTNKNCTVQARDIYGKAASIVTTETGSNTVSLPVGTYYVKEKKAPENYELNETVYPFTIAKGETAKLEVNDTPFGELDLRKESANPDMTDTDSSYSLAGALYEVFVDKTLTEKVGELTTTADGTTNVLMLKQGTYYVKEKTASPGFKLCDGTSGDGADINGVHIVTVEPGKKATFTCKEEPYSNFGYGMIVKTDSVDPSKTVAGAEYTIYTDAECTQMADTWDGSEPILVTTETGSNIVMLPLLPEGQQYYVKETKAAENYELNPTVYPFTIVRDETAKLEVNDTPFGELDLRKESANLDLTDGNSNYSLEGAVYEVFADETLTEKVGELTTAADGTTNVLMLKQGTYYVKEKTASPGYKLCDGTSGDGADVNGVHIVTVEPGKKATFTCKEEPFPDFSYGMVVKTDSVDPSKTVAGAEYTIYTDAECTQKAVIWDGSEPVLVTTKTGSNVIRLEVLPEGQQYYVKETKAAENYELDPTVHPITIVSGQTTKLEVSDIPFGEMDLRKESAKPDMTEGNPCYSLEGAVYEVFADETLTEKVGELTTATDGTTNVLMLKQGTYYVKEKTASPGYKLCDGTSGDGADVNGVHIVTVEPGKKATFICKEEPLHDPFSLRLQKLDADTGEPVAVGSASLEGAQFEVTYFTNIEGTTDGTPTRTWVFKTDAKGQMRTFDESYLVVEKSDLLYKDEFGGIIYPLGTYHIKEIQPPLYYQMEGEMTFRGTTTSADVKEGVTLVIAEENDRVQITQGGRRIEAGNLALDVTEKVYKGSVTIWKKDESGSEPLSGVEFVLTAPDGTTMKQTTNADGKAVFDGLIPQEYTLTEVKTVDGHSLLADNITVTIPMSMTEEELIASGADKTKAVWDEATGTYCFFDVTYTVTNSVTLDMPMTGGNPVWLYLMMGMAAVCIVTGVYFRRRTH